MKKWNKIALLTAPFLIGGTVYALAAGGSTSEQAAATTEGSAVSYKVVKAEALTPEEIEALQQAKVAPSPEAEKQTASVDPLDPFVMYKEGSTGTATAPAATPSAPAAAPAPAPVTPNEQFDLANVKSFEWKTMTTQGELKLEFKNDDGEIELEGEWNGRKIEVEGEQAIALLAGLLQNAHLNEALTAKMQGKQVALDAASVEALEDLKIELQDGRKIEAKGNGNGNNPKAEGRHDNGNHYGQDKEKKAKEKEKKGKDDKHGNDD